MVVFEEKQMKGKSSNQPIPNTYFTGMPLKVRRISKSLAFWFVTHTHTHELDRECEPMKYFSWIVMTGKILLWLRERKKQLTQVDESENEEKIKPIYRICFRIEIVL